MGHMSPGWNYLPFFLSGIHHKSERSLSQRTRLWKIFSRYSVVSSTILVERYCAQVRAVTFAGILNSSASQAFRQQSMFHLTAPELFTCLENWIIAV